ncbi:sugar phosphate nucleotidyltransferase [Victivallis sp. Marseille-Q1083]|uniref:nucleotidyltransferase family protein n=1 Tax=Victivallis sp. Marseille-Q1083 TaxID=2717288 RepID=UPI00158F248F|nr:sugar phosphate nucleotidyltransferase [Victivallis sp. Marseille-Q1083]
MKPTLLVLAAGMGSRYGGLKQLDQLGPSGETIMDYSIYDAIRAGFGKVVFIIRHDIEKEFKDVIGKRYEGRIAIDYAFQSLDDLPAGFSVPEGRQKPWGTGQAVYAARDVVREPFAVINADDFYGADGYRKLAEYLSRAEDKNGIGDYCMCAFVMRNTLSENGSVSRGVCEVDASGDLTKVVEHAKIERAADGRIVSTLEDGSAVDFTGEELVSMNMWGFTPSLFGRMEALFSAFLQERGRELKSEFYIPFVADALIHRRQAQLKVLTSADAWFGITYREDRPHVVASIQALVDRGVYPAKLFA